SVITLGVGNAIHIHFRVFDLVLIAYILQKMGVHEHYMIIRKVLFLAPQTLQVCPVIIVNRAALVIHD
ncbi:hypothetical protein ACJX0J_034417, partial [Zea mays]